MFNFRYFDTLCSSAEEIREKQKALDSEILAFVKEVVIEQGKIYLDLSKDVIEKLPNITYSIDRYSTPFMGRINALMMVDDEVCMHVIDISPDYRLNERVLPIDKTESLNSLLDFIRLAMGMGQMHC